MIGRRQLLLATAGLGAGSVPAGEPWVVNVPRHEALQDPQIRYVQNLLKLALERDGHQTRLQPTKVSMVQSRALLELARPDPPIDVFWTMTNAEREHSLLPVRIPLDRGLLGWRLLLVRQPELAQWRDVHTLAELAQHKAGQMGDWPDTEILRANGLPVVTGTHFESLFSWLAQGRFDYFPRSVLEIGLELQEFGPKGLVIAPHVMLQYPTALYFFVAPARPTLAAALNRGMESLAADGTLERLWQQQFGDVIERYKMRDRHLLSLHNPLLPAETPLKRKELWFGIKEAATPSVR